MNRLYLGTRRVWERSLALALFAIYTLPALAWSQVDSTTGGTSSSHSSTSEATTTTVTRTEFIYDWRLWAAAGAVLLVILLIAVSRGQRSDNQTTIIK